MKLFHFTLLLFFIPSFGQGQECDCEDIHFSDAYEAASLIFEGEVVRVNTNWISGGWKFTFKVNQSWKRKTDHMLIINSPWEKDCGYVFKEGERYLVYVRKKFSMKTYQCIGNSKFEPEIVLTREMGTGLQPELSVQYGRILWIMSAMVIAGILALGFVVLRKKIVKN